MVKDSPLLDPISMMTLSRTIPAAKQNETERCYAVFAAMGEFVRGASERSDFPADRADGCGRCASWSRSRSGTGAPRSASFRARVAEANRASSAFTGRRIQGDDGT